MNRVVLISNALPPPPPRSLSLFSTHLPTIPPFPPPNLLHQVKEVSGNVATVTASDGAEVRVTLSPELGSALDAPVVEFVAVVRGAAEVEEVARAPLAGAFGELLFVCAKSSVVSSLWSS